MPKKMTLIHNMQEVPKFRSDAAASKFWDTHSYSAELLATSPRGADPELAAILNRKPKATAKPKKTPTVRRTPAAPQVAAARTRKTA